MFGMSVGSLPFSAEALDEELGLYLEQLQSGRGTRKDIVQPFASVKRDLCDEPIAHAREVELLVRGEVGHLFNGVIPAYAMLQSAARINKSDQLDYVMLRRGCEELIKRAKALGRSSPTRLSWNVSASLLTSSDFIMRFFDILQETGFPADRVAIEILETQPLADTADVETRIGLLMAAGVQFHIDDIPDDCAPINSKVLSHISVQKPGRGVQTTDERIVQNTLESAPNRGRILLSPKGLKFAMAVRKALCSDNSEPMADQVRETLRDNEQFSVVTFEGGGDSPEAWRTTQVAIGKIFEKPHRNGHLVLIQGGEPLPVKNLPA